MTAASCQGVRGVGVPLPTDSQVEASDLGL